MTKANRKICLNVQRIVSEITNVDITKKSRRRSLVEGRGIYFSILRDHYGMSYQSIGETINMNHASVMYACKNFRYWLVGNSELSGWTDEAYNVVKGLTTIEDSRDSLTQQLHDAKLTIRRLKRKLREEITSTNKAVERYQNEMISLHKDDVLEKVLKNKKMKDKFPALVEQIKSELNRRYR